MMTCFGLKRFGGSHDKLPEQTRETLLSITVSLLMVSLLRQIYDIFQFRRFGKQKKDCCVKGYEAGMGVSLGLSCPARNCPQTS
jgi:hypothetical protein